jgi:hypothetical protein
MRKLILIKHAPPEVNPSISSEQWHLGEKGRKLCVPLAEKIRPLGPARHREQHGAQGHRDRAGSGEGAGDSDGNPRRPRGARPPRCPHMRSGEFISMMELMFRGPMSWCWE